MLASWTTGMAISAVNERYMISSPIVIPAWPFVAMFVRIAAPPISIIAMRLAPSTSDVDAPTAETPVSDCATLRNKLCAPFANTISSRFSAVYALTMRTPPSDSASRPVTSALILPRSRNSGRRRLNAMAMPPPNAPRIRIVTAVSRQFR